MKPELNKTLIRPGFSWRHFMDEAPLSKATLHYHNEYELILLVNYQGQVRVNHIDLEVNNCSLLLVPPQVPHFLGNLTKGTGNSERHSLWIDKNWISNMMTHCSEMHKLSKLLSNPMNGISFSHEAAISAYKVLNELDYGSSSLDQLSVLLRFLSVIATDKQSILLRSPLQNSADKYDCEQDKVDRLANFIDENYAKDITLDSVAEHIYCSSRTTNRIFQKHFGESFSQRLKKIRLGHAASLLETTRLSINFICHSVGYNNQSNFNRLFKSYKGMSPREYRIKNSN